VERRTSKAKGPKDAVTRLFHIQLSVSIDASRALFAAACHTLVITVTWPGRLITTRSFFFCFVYSTNFRALVSGSTPMYLHLSTTTGFEAPLASTCGKPFGPHRPENGVAFTF
jgi:hypothetical protein